MEILEDNILFSQLLIGGDWILKGVNLLSVNIVSKLVLSFKPKTIVLNTSNDLI